MLGECLGGVWDMFWNVGGVFWDVCLGGVCECFKGILGVFW